ncbi:hypothetical protein [Mesorhizobium sp. CA4]|uniref:hypothetical protein n=1 Tax=Mesorhizobium sp. CA4 TaxID=588499 RepID=UPI001CD10135|nr:hypothetical protein [Mesorhizobium sp. CA4]MBZ9818681.1 hypothetical protein [Mesorhizobium sp. CA4]
MTASAVEAQGPIAGKAVKQPVASKDSDQSLRFGRSSRNFVSQRAQVFGESVLCGSLISAIKFRTVVLSYFVAQNRLDWRIIAAIPAIVASGG